MIVRKIALNGWRNYEFAAAEFSPGTNVITGENAQGKTNLLEAVYLLTGGKSFRTRFDKELIGFGYTSAEVLADVFAFGREQTVRIVLRQGQRKQIWQNGVKKTAAELAGNFAAVLFCPDDLNIIRDGPAARRRMMDMAISQLRPKYGALLAEYSRLYDQKSAILRDWHEKPSLLDTLDDFSDQMCRVSAKLIRYRAAYASRLNIAAAPIHADFSGGREMTVEALLADITARPYVKAVTFSGGEPFAQPEPLAELAAGLKVRGFHLMSYSGYTFEELLALPGARPLLEQLDLLVDGPFVEARKDIGLRFRGSANQRVLDVPASLAAGAPLWCGQYR